MRCPSLTLSNPLPDGETGVNASSGSQWCLQGTSYAPLKAYACGMCDTGSDRQSAVPGEPYSATSVEVVVGGWYSFCICLRAC
eukprot:2020241-Rhodomonas_salina.1